MLADRSNSTTAHSKSYGSRKSHAPVKPAGEFPNCIKRALGVPTGMLEIPTILKRKSFSIQPLKLPRKQTILSFV